jgi:hypothetical protein
MFTGFDYVSFHTLLLLFAPYFNELSPYSCDGKIVRVRREKGRRRMISPVICLGLVLAWTCSRGNVFSLQLDFGLSHSCLCLWLHFGMQIVVNVLHEYPFARVQNPSREEVAAFQQTTAAKYPSLADVLGTLDGINIKIQSAKDDKVQSIFYNGWTHGHYMSNIFVFGMDGTIRICGLSTPSTMHNSLLADYSHVYQKLE